MGRMAIFGADGVNNHDPLKPFVMLQRKIMLRQTFLKKLSSVLEFVNVSGKLAP